MIAVRLISPQELAKRLAPYKVEKIKVFADGTELWRTGWNAPFTLTPEADGRYDDWSYFKLVHEVIARTIPDDWNGG